MAFENTTFSELFDEIAYSKPDGNLFQFDARILADGEEIYVSEVVNVRTVRDYISGWYDNMVIKIKIPNTVYIREIYPKKLKLEVELKYEITDNLAERKNNPEFWLRKFSAKLADPVDTDTIQVDKGAVDGSEKALTAMSTVRLQLMNKVAYEMRDVTCGGIYPEANMGDLIRTHLSYKLTDSEQRKPLMNKDFEDVRGVDLIEVDNTDTRMVIVEGNTNIVDLPLYLQKHYGVYNTGVGAYYQTNYTHDDWYQSVKGGMWFVYPIFNFTRYDAAPRTLDVLIVPEKEMIDVMKTFTYYDKNMSIIATGKTAAADFSEYNFYKDGNGVIFAKSSELLDDLHKTEDNRVYVDIGQTKREFIVKEREDGNNRLKHVKGNYTENPFTYASKLASSHVKIMTVQWSNAMPDLLIPAMPTKIKYLKKGEIITKNAVLLQVDTVAKKEKGNMHDETYSNHCVLTFAVELTEE